MKRTAKTRSESNAARHRSLPGFSLIELLVVISIIALLIAILLPSLDRARGVARQLKCSANLKGIALSQVVYSENFDGLFPPRGPERWVALLKEHYRDYEALVCPDDGDKTPSAPDIANPDDAERSYMTNGYNDYFNEKVQDVGGGLGPMSGWSMDRDNIPMLSEVVVFGEKRTGSGHFFMDMLENVGNQFSELEQSRHLASTAGNGSSNAGFGDGSVRSFRFPEQVDPINQWAVIDAYRSLDLP